MADLSKLQTEISALKESLRIKQQSIANINPKYQANQAYLAKLKTDSVSIQSQIAAKQAEVAALTAPKKEKATPKVDYGQSVRPPPYDETGTLNPGYGINDEGQPYWAGEGYLYSPPKTQEDVPPANAATPVRPPPYDETGALSLGYGLDEENNPVWIGPGYNDTTGQIVGETTTNSAFAVITPPKQPPKLEVAPDWRVRISLAPKSEYFYMSSDPGILLPLIKTKGVVFPYTPTISVGYTASYDTQNVTHSNFKMHNYQSSSVENITVTGDFTAQDISEANYMLAVIHFFRSATKMFYGKDDIKGTPPPLLYLSGHGQYQFDNHPMVLTGFTYSLPTDVDYINAYPNNVEIGINGASLTPFQPQSAGGAGSPEAAGPIRGAINNAIGRLFSSGLKKGGAPKPPVFAKPPKMSKEVTRVPTRINISLTFLPIVTRNAISNEFSLKDYASGKLLRGSQNPRAGGGIW